MHQCGMYTAAHMVVIGALKDTYYDPDEKRAVLSHSIEFLFSPFFQSWAQLLNRANEAGIRIACGSYIEEAHMHTRRFRN